MEAVVDLLLALVNRPNHGFDRQARAVACECLRQLERAFPGLLSEVAGHLWSLCQAERTHAVQAYLLLFTTVVYNVVNQKLKVSLLSSSVPLVPFNAPNWMRDQSQSQGLGPDQKELRRTLAFLLESPYLFTSCAMMEFMGMVVPLASALELQASMLKVQFLGMVYSFDPMLCHVVLLMYTKFPDAFEGQEKDIMRRLLLLSKETQVYLVFRLLALHWLMGLLSGEVVKRKSVLEMGQKFRPGVFDPLGLKALKLDLLVQCSVGLSGKSSGELLQECLVSVSDFKWLPPWSSETGVAFRTLHKFLISASTHSDSDPSTTRSLMESSLFQNLQGLLVDMTSEFQILVPVVVSFIERLINCEKHQWLGERFLQTIDEKLLPKLEKSCLLTPYFPLFHRIAENDTIPPSRLIALLTKFVLTLVDKRGFDVGLRLWDQGTEVLGVCRTLLSHHKSSRLFLGLSRLLSLICLYFPDLDVRDNARIYLRMLVCIPGRRLKNILKPADTVSPSTHSSAAFFTVQSPRFRYDPNKSWNISSYIHLERVTSLLVKQSWSLSLPSLGVGSSIVESKVQVDEVEPERSQELQLLPENSRRIESGKPTLRVMDAKVGEILERLRRYFSVVPDLRHMPGIKVRINCTLRLDAEPYSSVWGSQTQSPELDNKVDAAPPALFATVVKFSSSAPYGSIPSCRIPFLLGEWDKNVPNDEGSLDIVLLGNTTIEEEKDGLGGGGASVTVELEPREPTPGLVEVSMEANAESGQMIQGKLESVPVGIEDMFLKALSPPDEPEDTIPSYYADLFSALWEVCGSSSSTAHETFALKGGKTAAAISGTRSVKLLEVHAETVVQASELHLAPFVVAITGEQLVNIVREGGIIENIVWREEEEEEGGQGTASSSMGATGTNRDPLRLTYIGYGDDQEVPMSRSRGKLGKIKMLMFLPPRYHLLFEMEVGEESTLVHMRTDYWPCLAYVDDYLEALFLL